MSDIILKPGVALLQTGTWNASTGTEAITDEDLASILEAFEAGVLDAPILKIGHQDPRFVSRLEDGSPAYGWITNLQVRDGVLYGDYELFSEDLAEQIGREYPHSSVELARNVVLKDQEGNIVHEFACVLTANALLGATAPAVKGLTTKMSSVARLSAGSPTYVEIGVAQFSAVHAKLPGGNTALALAEKLSALVSERFSSETNWGFLEDFDDEVIYAMVSDGSSSVVYRQAYTLNDNGQPELSGDPVQVVKETKWVAEGERVAASGSTVYVRDVSTDKDGNLHAGPARVAAAQKKGGDTGNVHPQHSDPGEPESEEPPTPSSESQGETTMAVDKKKADELRKQYGLDPKSSTDELLAAVIADKEAGKSVAPGSDETPNPTVREQQADEFEHNNKKNLSEGNQEDDEDEDDEPRASEDDDEDEGEPADAVSKHNSQGKPATVNGEQKFSRRKPRNEDGTVKVSSSLFTEMQNRMSQTEARLAAREKAETDARRDGFVRQWYRDGLISDDECQRVRARLDRDEELTFELISERTPMFATEELGHAQSEPSMYAAGSKTELEAQYAADDALFSGSN